MIGARGVWLTGLTPRALPRKEMCDENVDPFYVYSDTILLLLQF
jgi:hypothetical protein